jgi:aminoglycoside phosphotransferase (APT) family kinase protein
VGARVGLDLPLGPKLASGRDADVFDLGAGRVLRRYRGEKTSEAEAETMRFVRERGYPVPAVHAVSGPDMVLDRVDGPTMLADLMRRPWMVWRHGRTLAGLHRRLHALGAPDSLAAFVSHPALGPGSEELRASVDAAIGGRSSQPAPSSADDAIIHLDLHPDNVILSRSGPVVIDWRNARRGDGAIDVAATWLIMATSEIDAPPIQRAIATVLRRLFVIAFLRHVDRPAAARQLPTMARYRLADRNLRPSERPAIFAMLR